MIDSREALCVLKAYIDAAVAFSRVFARFDAYEGTIQAMEGFGRDVKRDESLLVV